MYAPPGWFPARMQWPAAPFPPHPQPQQFNRPADVQPEQRPPVSAGQPSAQPDTRKPAVPLTPPQRKTADPKPESKQAENAPSSSQLLPRPTASKAPLARVARSSSNELAPAETQPVDEQILRDSDAPRCLRPREDLKGPKQFLLGQLSGCGTSASIH
eukprot:s10455_g1.t1